MSSPRSLLPLFFSAALLMVGACVDGPAPEDGGTAEPEDAGSVEPEETPSENELEACDRVGEAGTAVAAAETVDGAPVVLPEAVYTVTLPASGTGFVALDVATEHLDWQVFFDTALAATLTLEDGPLPLFNDGANPGCPQALPGRWSFHGDSATLYRFELTGEAGATVKLFAIGSASEHSTDGGHHEHDGGHHHEHDGGHHEHDGGHHEHDGGHHEHDGGHHHEHDGGHHEHDGGHHEHDGGHHEHDGGHHEHDGGHHEHDGGHHGHDGGHHEHDAG